MIDIYIPKMGMSTVEVDITAVLVESGAHVEEGDPLVEVEAEKCSFEVPAPASGVVKEILVAEGDVREVGDVVVRIQPGS